MAVVDYDEIISRAEVALAALLDGGAVEEYTIRGRSTRYMSAEELRETIDWAKRNKARSKGVAPWGIGVPGRPTG